MHEPLKRLPQRQEDPERYPRHIEAPAFGDILPPAIFLAGGITGCPDWQAEAITLFRGAKATVVNPRRRCPPPLDFEGAKEQISWEVFYLNRADLVLFWFPASWAVQPIALYELGKIAASSKPIAVGADPGYQRRVDVILQLSHARPGVEVHTTLAETVDDARRLLAAANPGPLRSGGSGGG